MSDDLIPVKVRVVIEYAESLHNDPDAYEGASTADEVIEKERQYINEDGDYLLQSLSCLRHTIETTIERVDGPEAA